MHRFFAFTGFVLVALALSGCAPGPSASVELINSYEHEIKEYRRACQDRDEQVRVIDEIEKLDRAGPAAERDKSQAQIKSLEGYRQRLNEDLDQQAARVVAAKKAMDEGVK